MADVSAQLDAKANEYAKVQQELQKDQSRRSTMMGQRNENKIVRDELDLVKENEAVFKLVGPVLVKQDIDEARGNVSKRLEFIEKELARIDAREAKASSHLQGLQQQIMGLREKYQASKTAAAGGDGK